MINKYGVSLEDWNQIQQVIMEEEAELALYEIRERRPDLDEYWEAK